MSLGDKHRRRHHHSTALGATNKTHPKFTLFSHRSWQIESWNSWDFDVSGLAFEEDRDGAAVKIRAECGKGGRGGCAPWE